MKIQVTALFESSSANGTFKWLDIGMRPHMLAKMHRLREAFSTDDAPEWFDFGVCAQMLVQARLLRESFRTEGTSEGSNTRVHSHMLLQAALLREPFPAKRALVRFHFRVNDAVVLVVLGAIQKHLATHSTRERDLIDCVDLCSQ